MKTLIKILLNNIHFRNYFQSKQLFIVLFFNQKDFSEISFSQNLKNFKRILSHCFFTKNHLSITNILLQFNGFFFQKIVKFLQRHLYWDYLWEFIELFSFDFGINLQINIFYLIKINTINSFVIQYLQYKPNNLILIFSAQIIIILRRNMKHKIITNYRVSYCFNVFQFYCSFDQFIPREKLTPLTSLTNIYYSLIGNNEHSQLSFSSIVDFVGISRPI